MAGCFLEFFVKLLILAGLLLVGCLLSTPVILIWACFGADGYWENVKRGYHRIWLAWCFLVNRV